MPRSKRPARARKGRGFAVVADEVRDLAAQSLHAAGEARRRCSRRSRSQVTAVSGQMERGREAVAGVEELSADAASALDAIVGTTGEAGATRRPSPPRPPSSCGAVDGLDAGRSNTSPRAPPARSSDTETLARRADEAAAGQADLERAIRELGEVASDLQRIARHFAVET